jgi:hypothetical protein
MAYGIDDMLNGRKKSAREKNWQELFEEEKRQKDLKALKDLLGSESGRWFFMRLFERCGFARDSFTGSSETFYAEGKRKIALMYLADVERLGIEGIKLKQAAELSYITAQLEIKNFLDRSC